MILAACLLRQGENQGPSSVLLAYATAMEASLVLQWWNSWNFSCQTGSGPPYVRARRTWQFNAGFLGPEEVALSDWAPLSSQVASPIFFSPPASFRDSGVDLDVDGADTSLGWRLEA